MLRTGIVDLGSNTARLVVYAYEPGKWFRLVDEIREPIRLGKGSGAGDRLDPVAMQRALAAIELYSDYARAAGLDALDVIATSAVRDAANRDEFLRAAAALGVRVQVLSGEEEARLGVRAVANSFDFDDAWVLDLGGGSVQVSRMEARRSAACRSAPLGAVRLTERLFAHDPPTRTELTALDAAVDEQLGPTLAEMRRDDAPLVAMGGTVRNLARAVQRSRGYPLDVLHGYFLDAASLEALIVRLRAMRARKRARVPGIHPDRADVILAGALVYARILGVSRRDGLWIAGQGIREGAFYAHFLPAPHCIADVRRFSVDNVFERYPQPRRHTRKVRKLAGRLFDGLRPLHGLDDEAAELLDAAAVLHDIGKAVNHYDHERHGAYLATSGTLPGFTHAEQVVVAQLIRYHRKGAPKPGPCKSLLERQQRRLLPCLATCLRLAEKLERSRAGRIRDLEVQIGDREVRVLLLAGESPYVELIEARRQAALFERSFGRALVLEARVPAGVVSP